MNHSQVLKALSRAIDKANPTFVAETGIHGRESAVNASPPDFPPTYYVTIRPRLGAKGPTAMFIITSAGRAMWARVHRTAEGCSYQFRPLAPIEDPAFIPALRRELVAWGLRDLADGPPSP